MMTDLTVKPEKTAGLLPTPPIPAAAGAVQLTENARRVFERRYVRRQGGPS
ncbi:MAG: hypothetical protein ACK2UW_16855 [Anaerolineales bacterium]